jgi:hypothetical protein
MKLLKHQNQGLGKALAKPLRPVSSDTDAERIVWNYRD